MVVPAQPDDGSRMSMKVDALAQMRADMAALVTTLAEGRTKALSRLAQRKN